MNRKHPFHILINLDIFIALTAFLVLLVVTFFGVIMRYFFTNPFIWQEEVQRWMILWVVSFGGSAAFRISEHIAIEMFVEYFPQRIQKFMNYVVYIIVFLTLGYMLIQSLQYTIQLAGFSRVTDVLKIPYQYVYIIVPICILLMILNFSYATYRNLFGQRKPKTNNLDISYGN